jgi:hypothetical protein
VFSAEALWHLGALAERGDREFKAAPPTASCAGSDGDSAKAPLRAANDPRFSPVQRGVSRGNGLEEIAGGARPLDWSVALRELACGDEDSDLDPLVKKKVVASFCA